MELKKNLEFLCGLIAVTGREQTAAGAIEELFRPHCDEIRKDSFGNIFCTKKGEGATPKNIMITAHYDEIGLIISGIDEGGFLRFSNMGGIDAKTLPSKEVTVFGKEALYGIIGIKPPHLSTGDEMSKVIPIEELRIDVGLTFEEATKKVEIGDVAGFNSSFTELKNNRFASKSMDNRAGVAALLEILNELKGLRHDDNVIVAATVQEELGLRGASVAAFSAAPDLGIVIDVCHGDMPDVPIDDQFPLGKGVAVGVGPDMSPLRTREILALASKQRIPVQIDPEAGSSGTEATAMMMAREGIPTVLLSIPCRYMHSTVETISLSDVSAAASLAARYIASCPFRREEASSI